jgi:hypothetical protein
MHPEADLKRHYKSTCLYKLMNGQYREEMLLWPQMEKIVEMNSVCHGICDECRHIKKFVEYGSVFRPVEYQSRIVLNDRIPEHRFESLLKQDKGYRHYKAGVEFGGDIENGHVENGIIENDINGGSENGVVDDGVTYLILKPYKQAEFDDKVSFISRLAVDVEDESSLKENGENGDDLNGEAEFDYQF